jgi:hypothetical protein
LRGRHHASAGRGTAEVTGTTQLQRLASRELIANEAYGPNQYRALSDQDRGRRTVILYLGKSINPFLKHRPRRVDRHSCRRPLCSPDQTGAGFIIWWINWSPDRARWYRITAKSYFFRHICESIRQLFS